VQATLELAITSQLDEDNLVQRKTHKVKRLINRTSATFINISHYESVRWLTRVLLSGFGTL